MKRLIISFFIVATVFFTTVTVVGLKGRKNEDEYRVALITDFADVNDASFNQNAYESCKTFCEKNKITFTYYKPTDNTDTERLKSMELAIDRGYNILVLPGYSFGYILPDIASRFPKVKFIGIDIGVDDLPKGYECGKNVFCATYASAISGFLAGYVSVLAGFERFGFLGGMECKSVTTYGYGFIQGVDKAAPLIARHQLSLHYVYGGQFFGDSDIQKYMDGWYKKYSLDSVFACGGSIYTSAALAARENKKYLIGVDTDQCEPINKQYAIGYQKNDFINESNVLCYTSALKGIDTTIYNKLQEIIFDDNWESGLKELGLDPNDPSKDYVKLPTKKWYLKKCQIKSYEDILEDIRSGAVTVSSDTSKKPSYNEAFLKVEYYPNIK